MTIAIVMWAFLFFFFWAMVGFGMGSNWGRIEEIIYFFDTHVLLAAEMESWEGSLVAKRMCPLNSKWSWIPCLHKFSIAVI